MTYLRILHLFRRGGLAIALIVVLTPTLTIAQEATSTPAATTTATTSAVYIDASTTALILSERIPPTDIKNITQPEELEEKAAIVSMFAARPVESPGIFSFMGYWVQQSVLLGIPANTIVLILLAPIIATLVAFVRVVLGLPTLELFVPIALSYALVAVGLVLGVIILFSVVIASYLSRVAFKGMSIMFFPKRTLSMLFLSIFVFAGLTISVVFDVEGVRNISIFPVLILMLLGDAIVSVQLYKSLYETTSITVVTIALGVLGFFLATNPWLQSALILYPEVVLLALPANVLIGRYFGLRLTEILRFKSLVTD